MKIDNRILYPLASPLAAVIMVRLVCFLAGATYSPSLAVLFAFITLSFVVLGAFISYAESISWGSINLPLGDRAND